jgi:hypothetical protein
MRLITKFLPSLMYTEEMINTNNLVRFVLSVQYIDTYRTVVIFRVESYSDYVLICEKLGDTPIAVEKYFE